MPTLRNLIEELERRRVNPDDAWIDGETYDQVVDAVEDQAEKEDD